MEKWIHGETNEFIDWLDTDGKVINASDGGIIFAEGKYHWYGQALRDRPFIRNVEGGQVTDIGIVMYESADLLNWTYEGVILPFSKDPVDVLYGPLRFERPKIIYNEKTKQYVLWCHYVQYPGLHGFEPGQGEAGVAVCDTVNGQYRWLGHSRPIDDAGVVRDCTLFKDRDGTAYFIYDRDLSAPGTPRPLRNRYLHVVKLSEDYCSFTKEYVRVDAAFLREAPAVVYHDGYYYMVTSGISGWDYNAARYYRAKSMLGEWEDLGDPCVDDMEQTTFRSQSTAIFRVEGKEELYIHMAERHNLESFLHCSYIWLPLQFGEDHTLSITYQKEWSLSEKSVPLSGNAAD